MRNTTRQSLTDVVVRQTLLPGNSSLRDLRKDRRRSSQMMVRWQASPIQLAKFCCLQLFQNSCARARYDRAHHQRQQSCRLRKRIKHSIKQVCVFRLSGEFPGSLLLDQRVRPRYEFPNSLNCVLHFKTLEGIAIAVDNRAGKLPESLQITVMNLGGV